MLGAERATCTWVRCARRACGTRCCTPHPACRPSGGELPLVQQAASGHRVGLTCYDAEFQKDLAHAADLDRSYVGQVKWGERTFGLDNNHRLAHALGRAAVDIF